MIRPHIPFRGDLNAEELEILQNLTAHLNDEKVATASKQAADLLEPLREFFPPTGENKGRGKRGRRFAPTPP